MVAPVQPRKRGRPILATAAGFVAGALLVALIGSPGMRPMIGQQQAAVDPEGADAAAAAAVDWQQSADDAKTMAAEAAAFAAAAEAAATAGDSAADGAGQAADTYTPKPRPEATETPGLRIVEACTPEHSEELAAQMQARRAANNVWTACPSGEWTDVLEQLLRTRGGPYRFVDIGCNKGYTSAELFARWAPELGLSPKTLHLALPDQHCGYCGDCNSTWQAAPAVPAGAEHPAVEVVCVEPNQVAFAQLVQMRDKFFKDPSKNWAQWHMVNAACGGGGPYVSFPRCKEAREECGLDIGGDIVLGRDTLPMLGVDALLGMLGWEAVDLLKMDTEGYDAPAVRTALGSLQGGQVGVLYFEYNGMGAWSSESLQATVDWLEGLDFVCYLAGNGAQPGSGAASLARLTACWSPLLEYKHWSNVVCVGRSHPLYPEMERMTLRYASHRATYYSEDGGSGDGGAAGGGGQAAAAGRR